MILGKPLKTKGLRPSTVAEPSTVNIPTLDQLSTNVIPISYQQTEILPSNDKELKPKELVLKIVERFAPIKISEIEFLGRKVIKLERGQVESILRALVRNDIMVRLKINNVYHYMVTVNDNREL